MPSENIKDFKFISESQQNLNNCRNLLQEIAGSCCLPERSKNMNAAFEELDKIKQSITTPESVDDVQLGINGIGEFGKKVGYLYATCCTEIREPLYQQMYKEMNIAHNKLWRALGHGH